MPIANVSVGQDMTAVKINEIIDSLNYVYDHVPRVIADSIVYESTPSLIDDSISTGSTPSTSIWVDLYSQQFVRSSSVLRAIQHSHQFRSASSTYDVGTRVKISDGVTTIYGSAGWTNSTNWVWYTRKFRLDDFPVGSTITVTVQGMGGTTMYAQYLYVYANLKELL